MPKMSSTISSYWRILEGVTDPEIPVLSITDLGIVRNVEAIDDTIIVTITPTYGGCPAMDMIAVNIKAAFQDEGHDNVVIKTVLYPPWTTDWLTETGMAKLLEYGIAPPMEKSTDKSFITNEYKAVACPRCQSYNTSLVSLFGSTACKAMYKCLDCLEPFDYFKCH